MDPRPTPASELVQVNLALPDLQQPTAQAEIVAAIENRAGVQKVEIVAKSLHIVYDPLAVTEHELEALLRQSGHPATEAETERDSPFA